MSHENILKRITDGRTDLVYEYLDLGNDATSTDKDGTRLVQWCAYYGDVSAIRFLLSNGESPLHAALSVGPLPSRDRASVSQSMLWYPQFIANGNIDEFV